MYVTVLSFKCNAQKAILLFWLELQSSQTLLASLSFTHILHIDFEN